jgi:hypothetical protein
MLAHAVVVRRSKAGEASMIFPDPRLPERIAIPSWIDFSREYCHFHSAFLTKI